MWDKMRCNVPLIVRLPSLSVEDGPIFVSSVDTRSFHVLLISIQNSRIPCYYYTKKTKTKNNYGSCHLLDKDSTFWLQQFQIQIVLILSESYVCQSYTISLLHYLLLSSGWGRTIQCTTNCLVLQFISPFYFNVRLLQKLSKSHLLPSFKRL